MEGLERVAAPVPGQRGAADTRDWTKVQRLLELARLHLGMDIAWISQFTDDQQIIRAVDGDAAAMNVSVGLQTPLQGSFCVRVLAGTLPAVIPAARRHPITRELPITHHLGIGSYVGTPLRGTDGQPAGMLCCLSQAETPTLNDQAPRFLALVADLISEQLGEDGVAAAARAEATSEAEHLRTILDQGRIRMVYQPIHRLTDGLPMAVEALARFDDPAYPTPAHAFAAASHAGLGAELELLAVRRALSERDAAPADVWFEFNLSAEVLVTPAAVELLLAHADRTIGVEITEHTQVHDYGRLTAVTATLQEAGIRIAVDDAGAGYASLRHILRLHPDMIKLDLELVRGIDTDPVLQALARALATFAGDIGAALIAEGIETEPERETLQRLGIPFGQGFLLTPPGPLDTVFPVPAVTKRP